MDAVKLHIHPHPLNCKELSSREENRVCDLCGKEVTKGSAYECSQCNFTAHLDCAENPPPLVIGKSKIHEHTLTLLPRHDVEYACNACGISGVKSSTYVCLKCGFMIHGDCIDFPCVIRISRHQHRLSHTWFLGPGEWRCGICLKKINGKFGAYNCTYGGCSYAVHSRCALREDVWDGEELEGKPVEYYEDVKSFEEVSNFVIRHFTHPQHVLRLEDEGTGDVFCSGCSFPFTSDPFYSCLQCDFFLHKTCANLPRKIYTALHVHPLSLRTEDKISGGRNGLSRCNSCDLHFNGFSYRCLECNIEFDVRCSSVSEPFQYHLHPHLLFFKLPNNENEEAKFKICNFCCKYQGPKHTLSCIECDFSLCMACATLPDKAIYKYDDHLLSHAMRTTDQDWCDICENKIEGKSHHHYECSDCGSVLHTDCAVGSFRNMKPGFTFITSHGQRYEVILNDRTSLMLCSHCHNDCNESLLLMSTNTTTGATIYLCSSPCLRAYVSI